MTVYKLSIFLGLVAHLSACATFEKSETLKKMAIAGAVGYVIGQQRENNKQAYGAMYGGLAASAVGAYQVYQDSSKVSDLHEENNQLRMKLDSFQKRYEPQLVQQGSSLFNSPLPKEVSSLVDPGEWKRYRMDQWVQDPNQSNIWYRQVEMFEIIPPVSR